MTINPNGKYETLVGRGLDITKSENTLIFGDYPIDKGYYVREAIKKEKEPRFIYFDNEGRNKDLGFPTVNCDSASLTEIKNFVISRSLSKDEVDFIVIDALESFYDYSVPLLRYIVRKLTEKGIGSIMISHQKAENTTTKFVNTALMFDKAVKLF